MAWEYDSTGGMAPLSTQQGWPHRLVVWGLLGLLLGSAAAFIVRHEYYPPMPSPQQAGVTHDPPAPLPISTAPGVLPSVQEGAVVGLTSATFSIPLAESLPQLSAGTVPLVAPPVTHWRLIIPESRSAYYDLRIDVDALLAAVQAGQGYLWYRSGETVTVLPGPAVSLAVQADHLIVTVHGPELEQMFAARPPVVTIEPSAGAALRTLVVSYSEP